MKNEAVMRLAGDIRQREKVNFDFLRTGLKVRAGCPGERGDLAGAARGQKSRGRGVQGAA